MEVTREMVSCTTYHAGDEESNMTVILEYRDGDVPVRHVICGKDIVL